MQKIVLIACVSKKSEQKSQARNLYVSPLFKYSLAYAESLKPDKIYILSALHHLLELDDQIEPYNVTLSNVPKDKRKPGLKVLNGKEQKEWGEKVIDMLKAKANVEEDQFIILAGSRYIKPIKGSLKNYIDVLNGISLFKRISFLKQQLYDRTTS
jgi:hypothetical protein